MSAPNPRGVELVGDAAWRLCLAILVSKEEISTLSFAYWNTNKAMAELCRRMKLDATHPYAKSDSRVAAIFERHLGEMVLIHGSIASVLALCREIVKYKPLTDVS